MKYETVVFDMDGTILNTLDDIADSLNHALRFVGYPERTIDEIRNFVGNGIRALIERAVPSGTEKADTDRVHEAFTEHYKVHCYDKTLPYPGVIELIRELRAAGCRTAVVSNKADYAVQELCVKFFDGLFDFAVGEREGIRRKPAPDSVNTALKTLGTSKRNAVYIGDSDVDLKTAENSGIDCIAVEWGFRSREFLLEHGAKIIAADTARVKEEILGNGVS